MSSELIKSKKSATVDVSVAGWFLLIASIWELVFNRLFAALGVYSNVGAAGTLSYVAVSGHFAMNATGVMALILTCILLPRLSSDPKLSVLPARIILMLDAETPGADANQDGEINVLDMTKIARIILMLD